MGFFRRIARNLGLVKDGAQVAYDDVGLKKIILKVDLQYDKEKQKAMKAASSFSGVHSVSVDMKYKTLTVIGDVDPVFLVAKLRKNWYTEMCSVGSAIEQEESNYEPNKDDPNQDDLIEDDEPKKDDTEKDETKKDDETKQDEPKKDEPKKDVEMKTYRSKQVSKLVKICMPYNPYLTTQYHYCAQSTEENPDAYDIQNSTALQTMMLLQLLWIASNHTSMRNLRQTQKC